MIIFNDLSDIMAQEITFSGETNDSVIGERTDQQKISEINDLFIKIFGDRGALFETMGLTRNRIMDNPRENEKGKDVYECLKQSLYDEFTKPFIDYFVKIYGEKDDKYDTILDKLNDFILFKDYWLEEFDDNKEIRNNVCANMLLNSFVGPIRNGIDIGSAKDLGVSLANIDMDVLVSKLKLILSIHKICEKSDVIVSLNYLLSNLSSYNVDQRSDLCFILDSIAGELSYLSPLKFRIFLEESTIIKNLEKFSKLDFKKLSENKDKWILLVTLFNIVAGKGNSINSENKISELLQISEFIDHIDKVEKLFKGYHESKDRFYPLEINIIRQIIENKDTIISMSDEDFEFMHFLLDSGFRFTLFDLDRINNMSVEDKELLKSKSEIIKGIMPKQPKKLFLEDIEKFEKGGRRLPAGPDIGAVSVDSLLKQGKGGFFCIRDHEHNLITMDELLNLLRQPNIDKKLQLLGLLREYQVVDNNSKYFELLKNTKEVLYLSDYNVEGLINIMNAFKNKISVGNNTNEIRLSGKIIGYIFKKCKSNNGSFNDIVNLLKNDVNFLNFVYIKIHENKGLILDIFDELGIGYTDQEKIELDKKLYSFGIVAIEEYYEYLIKYHAIGNVEMNDDNYHAILAGFAFMQQNETLPDDYEPKKAYLKYFPQNDPKNKNFILAKHEEIFMRLLRDGVNGLIDYEKQLFYPIDKFGLGHLTYIENLSRFMDGIGRNIVILSLKTMKNANDVKTKLQKLNAENLRKGLFDLFYGNKRFSDEEKNNLYCVFMDIMESAPSMLTAYLNCLNKLTPSQIKTFIDSLFKNLHIHLLLNGEGTDDDSGIKYNKISLVNHRNILKNFIKKLDSGVEFAFLINETNKQVEDELKSLFQKRFGLKKVPENFDNNQIRTIKNFSMFLANMNERDGDKEKVLKYCLALYLNGKWDIFRKGEYIDPSEYFDNDVSEFINDILNKKDAHINSIWGSMIEGIDMDNLQKTEVLQMIGNVQTIDEVLISINQNIDELSDEDVYQGDERLLLKYVKKYGKNLGSMFAMWFQVLAKNGSGSLEDRLKSQGILELAIGIVNDFGLESIEFVDKDKIKHFQTVLKQISPVMNFLDKIKGLGISDEINKLKLLKKPNDKMIEYFNRVGEDFSNESGVIPISNDVNYLKNIIEKNPDKFTDQELEEIISYLTQVGNQIDKLYEIKKSMDELLTNLIKQYETSKYDILKQRINAIKEEINKDSSEKKSFHSQISNDLNDVIENIRACLSCTHKECNNDTNLSFIDFNKFFITSRVGNKGKTFADQLVTVFSNEGGPLFVLDYLYGERVQDVLINHILLVIKKMKTLGGKVKLFIPNGVYSYLGFNALSMNTRLSEFDDGIKCSDVVSYPIKIDKPTFGDLYNDFSGGRGTGNTALNGILIEV